MRADGETCTRALRNCVHTCVFANATDATGICGQISQWPAVGQPCAANGICSEGRADLAPDGSSCACIAPLPPGSLCDPQRYLCDGACRRQGNGEYRCESFALPAPTTPLGGACLPTTGCAQGECRLGPGALDLTCIDTEAECQPFSECSPAPVPNGTAATARAAPSGAHVAETFCLSPGSHPLWWRVDGAFSTGDALSLALHPELVSRGYFAGNVRFNIVEAGADGQPDLSTEHRCEASGQANYCTAFIRAPAASVWIVVTADVGVAAQLSVRFAPRHIRAANVTQCSPVPANLAPATATPITLGQTTQGRFCSSGTDTEYFWEVPGSFLGRQEFMELEATPPPGREITLGFAVPGSGLNLCTFPMQNGTRCVYTSYRTDTFLVTTHNNPSLLQDMDFSFRVTLPQDPGWLCNPTVTNGNRSTALPLFVGTPIQARHCGSQAPFALLYWRVTSELPAGSLVRVNAAGLSEQGIHLVEANDDFEHRCTDAQRCVLHLPNANTSFFVALEAYGQTAESTVTLSVTPTTDPLFDACPNPPTNITRRTAAALTSGQAVSGTFCSNAARVGTWFRLSGPIAPGTFSLVGTITSGPSATPLVVRAWADLANGPNVLGGCVSEGGTFSDCAVSVPPSGAPELFLEVLETQNITPTAMAFTLTLTRNP